MNGNNVYLASCGNHVKLWDFENLSLIKKIKAYPPDGHASICWSTDNMRLACTSTKSDNIILTYPLKDDEKDVIINTNESKHKTCLVFNTTSRFLMAGGQDGFIHIWDARSLKLKKTYKNVNSEVTCIRFSKNDLIIAAGHINGELCLYNVTSGWTGSILNSQDQEPLRDVSFSRYQTNLAATINDGGSTCLWDVSQRKLLHTFEKAHTAPSTCLIFSPLNQMLMLSVGMDKRIVLYDSRGYNILKSIMCESALTSISMHHDCTTVAVGSIKGFIHLYDVRCGKNPIKSVSAHNGLVHSLAFQSKQKSVSSDKKLLDKETKNNSTLLGEEDFSIQNIRVKENHVDLITRRSFDTDSVISPYRNDIGDFHTIDPSEFNSFNKNNIDNISSYDLQNSFETHLNTIKTTANDPNFSENGIFSPLADDIHQNIRSYQGINETLFNLKNDLALSNTIKKSQVSKPTHIIYYDQQLDNSISKKPYPINNNNNRKSPQKHSPYTPIKNTFSQNHEDQTVERKNLKDLLDVECEGDNTFMYRNNNCDFVSINNAGNDEFINKNTNNDIVINKTAKSSAKEFDNTQKQNHKTNNDINFNNLVPNNFSANLASGFSLSLLRNVVRDEVEDYFEKVHDDIANLQVLISKKFQYFETEITKVIELHSIRNELLIENQQLREENERLKKNY